MEAMLNSQQLKDQSAINLPIMVSIPIISFLLMYFSPYLIPTKFLIFISLFCIVIMFVFVISFVSTVSYLIVDVKGYRLDVGPSKDRYLISKSPLSGLIVREFIK